VNLLRGTTLASSFRTPRPRETRVTILRARRSVRKRVIMIAHNSLLSDSGVHNFAHVFGRMLDFAGTRHPLHQAASFSVKSRLHLYSDPI
jgi:hypothetical protein